MTDNPPDNTPVDYEAKYKEILAERDAYANKLNEYVDANNKLKADLAVQQAINRKTLGASATPPKEDDKPAESLKDRLTALRERANGEKK